MSLLALDERPQAALVRGKTTAMIESVNVQSRSDALDLQLRRIDSGTASMGPHEHARQSERTDQHVSQAFDLARRLDDLDDDAARRHLLLEGENQRFHVSEERASSINDRTATPVGPLGM